MSGSLPGSDVLAFGAHPDDVEIGCGGTLATAARGGARVVIVDLSAGELSTRGTRDGRAREAAHAAELLGVAERANLGLADGSIGFGAGDRAAVVAALRRHRPRIVLAPYHVADRHPDHAATGRLVRDACFLGGVAAYGPGTPWRPARIYHYMLHEPFEPTFVLDVSGGWEPRVRALAAYASQFAPEAGGPPTELSRPGFLEFLEARARFYGGLVGAAAGEPFLSVGPLGLGALPGAGEPPRFGGYRATL